MNVLLWIGQFALALLSFAGGSYKVFQVEQLAKVPAGAALSATAWRAIGLFEILCALALVIPGVTKMLPVLAPSAATALALESLGLAILYAQYSLALSPSNPLVYVVVMGLMAVFVAYGRFSFN